MGSKGGAAPPPVCCMCGDHGLTQELFKCKVCLVRSQHRYCSDLYPKAESHRACNWCLRDEGAKALSKEVIIYNNSNSISSSSNNNNEVSNVNTGTVKLNRGAFSAQFNKPVKKPRVLDRSASDVTDRIRPSSDELSPRLGRTRRVFRGKVRRYKLLEEVSS
ncbi:hypothetical protein Cni_G27311 [Canna indica]|uniref:PHD-type zinc finger plants domain-containing protein n=1 Tax=Canna indica TaxID=4628 RepID=A0AAQ3L0Z1_9LILI|nr:hypothetical protein Cni_G27311 [Canna indica]